MMGRRNHKIHVTLELRDREDIFQKMNEATPDAPSRWIVFFDGTCSLCDRSVRLLHAQDCHRRLWFSQLQGKTARRLGLHVDLSEGGTMLLVQERNGEVRQCLERGDGLLKILRLLGGVWRIIAALGRLFPRPLRDRLYRWIAKNRYRWFGEKEECGVPDETLRQRILE